MWTVVRNPWTGFNPSISPAVERVFDQLFDEFTQVRSTAFLGWGASAEARLTDDGANLVFEAVVPGLTAADIELDVTATGLTVSGERKVAAPEGYKVHRQERQSYRFSRSFRLPFKVDPDATTAEVKNGVLTIKLPKAPEVKPKRIQVNG